MNAAALNLRRNTRLYYAFVFLAQFLLWGGVWIKYLVDDRGLELKYILLMDFPFWMLVALLQAPTGALADHIGRKRVLALSGALYGVTILGFGFTTNYWMLFLDYVIWAFAQSTQTGADQALIYDTLKLAGRESHFKKVVGRGIGLGFFASFMGVVLGSLLASRTSLSFVVQLSAVFPFLSLGVSFFMWEPPIERHAERHYWRDMRAALSFGWGDREVRYTLLIGAVLMTATFGPVVLIQPFLLDHDVATSLYGPLQAPLRITSAVASLVAYWIGRRLGVPRLLLVSCLVIFFSYTALAAFDTVGAFAFFAIPAVIAGITNPVVSNHLNERIPSERRATVLSLLPLAFAFQVAFFEPALGLFADDVSLRAAFIFSAVYFAILMPPLLVLWRRAHSGASAVPPGPIASQPA